jgi:hypothetical protein
MHFFKWSCIRQRVQNTCSISTLNCQGDSLVELCSRISEPNYKFCTNEINKCFTFQTPWTQRSKAKALKR